MKSPLLALLLFALPLFSAQETYEKSERSHKEAEALKTAQKASRELQAAIERVDFPAIMTWLAVSQNKNERADAIAFVLNAFDPQALEKEHAIRFKQFISEVKQYAKDSGRASEIGAAWRSYLFPAQIAASTAAAASAVAVAKTEKDEKAVPVRTVILRSKEGTPHTVDRTMFEDPKRSSLIATALEDADASEVSTGYKDVVLKEMINAMRLLSFAKDEQGKDVAIEQLSEARKKQLVDGLDNQLAPIQTTLLVDLIKNANHAGSQLLLQAYLRRYARWLDIVKSTIGRKNPKAVTEEIKSHNFPLDIISLIARAYFLKYDQGIDADVEPLLKPNKNKNRLIPIPVDVLVAYGKIPQAVLDKYPRLAIDPNEYVSVQRVNVGVAPYTEEMPALIFAADWLNNIASAVPALLRVPKINVNAQTKEYGHAALDFVVNKGPFALIPDFLRAGADPNLMGSMGNSALHWAAAGAGPDVIAQLVAAGARMNAENQNGETPLMIAIKHGSPEAIKLLLERGVRLDRGVSTGTVQLFIDDLPAYNRMQEAIKARLQQEPGLKSQFVKWFGRDLAG